MSHVLVSVGFRKPIDMILLQASRDDMYFETTEESSCASSDATGAAGTWTRYHNGAFTEPGVGGKQTCLPGLGANIAAPIVHWNTFLELADAPLLVFLDGDGDDLLGSELFEKRAISEVLSDRLLTLSEHGHEQQNHHEDDYPKRQVSVVGLVQNCSRVVIFQHLSVRGASDMNISTSPKGPNRRVAP